MISCLTQDLLRWVIYNFPTYYFLLFISYLFSHLALLWLENMISVLSIFHKIGTPLLLNTWLILSIVADILKNCVCYFVRAEIGSILNNITFIWFPFTSPNVLFVLALSFSEMYGNILIWLLNSEWIIINPSAHAFCSFWSVR